MIPTTTDDFLLVAALLLNNHEQYALPMFMGSVLGQETIDYDRVVGHVMLFNDYFNHVCTTYTTAQF
jgi:hypothetical protein